MDIEAVFFAASCLFLIGAVIIFIKDDAVSVFVAYQVIITASVINLLNFSTCPDAGKFWADIFLLQGLLTVYLLIFAVYFHIYSKVPGTGDRSMVAGYRLFSIKRTEWWGEDNI
jgi:NADH:ubiquinone oxidoreductase subunit K